MTGNYAGDVMNFTLAADTLKAEGIDARYLVVTDDIASAPAAETARRRGIAGGFAVFKAAAAAAAAEGYALDGVEQVARRANDRTRTLGVGFDGCTLPGAAAPLFSVPGGRMGVGLGIHGEPGIAEEPLPAAAELAALLVASVTAERPAGPADGSPPSSTGWAGPSTRKCSCSGRTSPGCSTKPGSSSWSQPSASS